MTRVCHISEFRSSLEPKDSQLGCKREGRPAEYCISPGGKMAGCSLDNAQARRICQTTHPTRPTFPSLLSNSKYTRFHHPFHHDVPRDNLGCRLQFANIRFLPKVPASEFELRLNYIPILVV